MFSKKIVALAAVAAMAEQVVAFNSHRHLHQAVEKRAEETCLTTVWETVTVTAGNEPAPTSVTSVQVEVPAEPTSTEEAPAPKPTTMTTMVKPAPTADKPVESVPAVLNPIEASSTQAAAPTTTEAAAPKDSVKSAAAVGFPKRGLAYNNADLANGFKSACGDKCGWAYNWGSTPGNLDPSLSYVPLLHGDKPEFTDPWANNVEAAISAGSKAIFSVNEPDNAGQAALSVDQAVAVHKQYMNPFSGRVLVGAPSVTNSGDPNEGLAYLQQWVDACNGECSFDFCNVHWYSEYEWSNTLFDHIDKAHQICGKPIWLTEFAPVSSDDKRDDFMREVIPQLDAIDYLDAYSYFWVDEGLMNGNSPSSFGSIYASV